MNPLKQAILDFCDSNALSSPADFSLEVLSVRSVDCDNRSCVLYDINGNEFKNIRVQFVGASTFLLPAPDSLVIAFVSRQLCLGYVLSTSIIEAAEVVIGDNSAIIDTDGIRLKTANMSADFNADDIILNGGDLNGLVIIQNLTDKLNELKDTVNDLISKYNAHIHVTTATVGTGPAGVLSPTESTATPAKAFNKDDYENKKIKQ
ncbi:MAG: hypothetical protein NC548_50985 [Lachnospiraceae bacterium]|nr:hypothetical protein [Lachnospiraceae bacterium]